MRWQAWMVGLLILGTPINTLAKDEDTDKVVGGITSGIFGPPAASPDAVYTAKERDRLVSLLRSGQYVTSRQGEPVDLMVYGVPLTRSEHVYTARPVQPSQTGAPQPSP